MKLALIDDRGNIVETFELDDYNLDNPIARSVLVGEVQDARRRAVQAEIQAVNDYEEG